MKWRSIKDDPPTVDRYWYLVRSEGGVPHLAILENGRLTLWDDELSIPNDDAMGYEEWLEVPV